jgi:hypothetical protein
LCGDVSRGGITIRVEIYRLAGRGEGWSLEVVDQEGGSTVWDDLFATDQEAYAEFCRALSRKAYIHLPSGHLAEHINPC